MPRRRADDDPWIDFPPLWPERPGGRDRPPEERREVVLTTAIPRTGGSAPARGAHRDRRAAPVGPAA